MIVTKRVQLYTWSPPKLWKPTTNSRGNADTECRDRQGLAQQKWRKRKCALVFWTTWWWSERGKSLEFLSVKLVNPAVEKLTYWGGKCLASRKQSNLFHLKQMHPFQPFKIIQGWLTGIDNLFSTLEYNRLLFRHGKCLYKHIWSRCRIKGINAFIKLLIKWRRPDNLLILILKRKSSIKQL